MRHNGAAGSHSPFPGAVPGHGAGWIRVTHPSAGRRQEGLLLPAMPLDLHVLGL